MTKQIYKGMEFTFRLRGDPIEIYELTGDRNNKGYLEEIAISKKFAEQTWNAIVKTQPQIVELIKVGVEAEFDVGGWNIIIKKIKLKQSEVEK